MSMLDALARVAVAMAEQGEAAKAPAAARAPESPRPAHAPPRSGAAGAGFAPARKPTAPEAAPAPVAAGGFGDLLGQILGGGAPGRPAPRGGLGGALDELSQLSRPSGGAGPKPSGGSFGDLLNDRVAGRTSRAPSAEEDGLAQVLLSAMLQAAKADGRIDRDERGRIMKALGPNPGRAEMEFLDAEMAKPVDVNGLARQVPRGAEGQAYMMSLMAIDLDMRPEAEYLHALAQALRMDPAEINAIHDRLGAPRIYR